MGGGIAYVDDVFVDRTVEYEDENGSENEDSGFQILIDFDASHTLKL